MNLWARVAGALAAVLPSIGTMRVATTIALPVIRGPGPLMPLKIVPEGLSNPYSTVAQLDGLYQELSSLKS